MGHLCKYLFKVHNSINFIADQSFYNMACGTKSELTMDQSGF